MSGRSYPSPRRQITRRELLTGAAGALGAGAFLRSAGSANAAPGGRVAGLRHLVWVWQFSVDAAPNLIGAALRDHGLGIVLKTHDGIEWMSQYDKSPFAVSGPAQIETLTHYYEDAGVPFHAWAVIKGIDIIREARMAADVIGAGVRSLFLDIEPFDGFWRGTPADALLFGREIRRLQPEARLVTSLDPRPWVSERLPLREFASFSNEIAPQNYWRSFNTSANRDRFTERGLQPPPEGITPEFLTDVANALYSSYGLPISPVGQGVADAAEWSRFVGKAFALGSKVVSVWRYGVAARDVFPLLRDTPPPAPPPTAAAGATYIVEAGDTLFAIASRFGVPMDAIVQANGLADPNYLFVGQQLVIPGGSTSVQARAEPAPPPVAPNAGGRTYKVQAGDTLSAIAARFGTTVGAIAQLNGISDPNYIYEGQVLQIP